MVSYMSRVQINPSLISWAADQAGLSLDDFAHKLSTRDAEKIKTGSLSEGQAIKAAKIANIKLYHLFLEEPPAPPQLPLSDFRTLITPEPLSQDFYDVYRDVEYKQQWFKDYLVKEGADTLPFVGKFSATTEHKLIADDIRKALAIDARPSKIRQPQQYYNYLVQQAEELGILVFKNGVVANNTSRPLSVSEFRGFAIADPIAPVIFINGRDAPAAWVFTLVHELAHIWRGESSISDASSRSAVKEEVLCNRIAAEVLVPEAEFLDEWHRMTGTIEDKLRQARSFFIVSQQVIARRALDLGLIANDDYAAIVSRDHNITVSEGSAGGNFYATLNLKNSKKLTNLITSLANAGALSFTEAARLLQTTPANVMTIYRKNNNALSS